MKFYSITYKNEAYNIGSTKIFLTTQGYVISRKKYNIDELMQYLLGCGFHYIDDDIKIALK